MYSESDIQSAVESGILDARTAAALRDHVAGLHATSVVDEEHFRLVTGFNDIFVSIASIILLVAVGWIGGGLLVAGAAWGLAEYFTRVRRMALPSILLLLAFTGGLAWGLFTIIGYGFQPSFEHAPLITALIAMLTAAGTYAHWLRFKVPITVAAATASVAAMLLALLAAASPVVANYMFLLILTAGLAIFAFAMWWDMSDRVRETRRSDVAFWLHLTAAPMIAHSIFNLLGVFTGDMAGGRALLVIGLYLIFGLVALAIDRRALLVSSLAYVLYAMGTLLESAATTELTAPLTALVIGSALLLLSAFWHWARRWVVTLLPDSWQMRLPPAALPESRAA